jgi:hypothetical protein
VTDIKDDIHVLLDWLNRKSILSFMRDPDEARKFARMGMLLEELQKLRALQDTQDKPESGKKK